MIRRTFTLVSAAVLALGSAGLAGPAAADDAGTIQALPAVIISEIGVEMDTTVNGQDINGDFIELKNETSSNVPLGGFTLKACNASTGLTTVVPLGTNNVVPANGHLLIANSTYAGIFGAPMRDLAFDSGVDQFLEQTNGGVELVDTINSLEHTAEWGTPQSECQNFFSAPTPNDDESLNWNSVTEQWVLAAPSPINANGDTV